MVQVGTASLRRSCSRGSREAEPEEMGRKAVATECSGAVEVGVVGC